jgi:site-specific DNA-adenine methylase
MWQALMRGETEPFADVTEEEFKRLKYAPASARRGFVRFGGSFGGDFMAGYGRHHSDNPQRQFTWQDTQRNLQKFTQYSSCLDFIHTDYKSTPDTTLVYADPPYAGTYLYQGRSFDHAAFWSWVRQRKGPTFISELTGPDDIDIVWRKAHKSQNASNSPTTKATAQIITREERLYYKPGVSP